MDHVHENTQKSLIYHKPFLHNSFVDKIVLNCGLQFILLYCCSTEKIDMLSTEGFSTVKKKRFIIVWVSGVFGGKRPFGHFRVPKNCNFQNNEAYIWCKTFPVKMNRPLPSSKNPHFQKEATCTTFLVKMSFICMRMRNHFHIEGWALHLALIQRPGGTPKTYCICTIKGSISNQQLLSRFETEAGDNSKMACCSWLCVKKQRKRKLDKEASKQVRQKHMVTGASFLEWYLWEGEG